MKEQYAFSMDRGDGGDLQSQYEKQGITIETVKILADRLQRLVIDPHSVAKELVPEIEKKEKIRDEKQKEYDALWEELGKCESRLEDLEYEEDEEDEESEKYKQARKEYEIVVKKYSDFSREFDVFREELQRLRDLYHSYYAGNFTHLEAFYRSSSDALNIVREQVEVKDKKVSTVASSGDLWQIFADQGAKEIDVFDVSLPAIFFSELKLQALNNLNYQEYLEMFGKGQEDIMQQVRDNEPFFDVALYEKIKAKLSPQAMTYFDTLLADNEKAGLMADNRFIRFRRNDIFIGDIITEEKKYQALQKKVGSIQFTFRLGDIKELYTEEELNTFDLLYLSNINYLINDSLALAESLLKSEQQKCIITTAPYRLQKDNARYIYPEPKMFEAENLPKGGVEIKNSLGLNIKLLGSAGIVDGKTVLEVSLKKEE